MSRLEIHIGGITRTKLERAQEQLRQPNALSGTRVGEWLRGKPLGPAILGLSPLGLAIASVVLVAGVAYVSTPVALINDIPIRARHVLLLADPPLQSAADAQISILTGAGISVYREGSINVRPSGGFLGALSRIDDLIAGLDLPNSVQRELPRHPDVDAVYVLSSFANAYDPARLAELQELTRRNGVRLYLHTVDNSPSPDLLAIARESGGGLINPAQK